MAPSVVLMMRWCVSFTMAKLSVVPKTGLSLCIQSLPISKWKSNMVGNFADSQSLSLYITSRYFNLFWIHVGRSVCSRFHSGRPESRSKMFSRSEPAQLEANAKNKGSYFFLEIRICRGSGCYVTRDVSSKLEEEGGLYKMPFDIVGGGGGRRLKMRIFSVNQRSCQNDTWSVYKTLDGEVNNCGLSKKWMIWQRIFPRDVTKS